MPGENLSCRGGQGRRSIFCVGRRRRVVLRKLLIHAHGDIGNRDNIIVTLCRRRLGLLSFELGAVWVRLGDARAVVWALALLRGVTAGTGSRDLALALVGAVALLLLELLCGGANAGEAWSLADLVRPEKRFIHGDIWPQNPVIKIVGHATLRKRDAPVKPVSLSALTVRRTCSMQGLKQHIRVERSF